MPTPMSLIFLPPAAAPIVTKPTCFCLLIALPLLECGVERHAGRGEIGPPHQSQRVRCAPVAVHARVLPFDRERGVVTDSVEGADERLEINVAVTWRHECPAPIRLAEVDVGAEDRPAPVEHLLRVLDVNVVDAIRELLYEGGRVQELVGEVARIEVDAESRPAPDRIERLARGHEVVSDLGRVDLEAEADALPVEDVDDGVPTLGKVGVASLDFAPVIGRKGIKHVPGRRAGEAVDQLYAEL